MLASSIAGCGSSATSVTGPSTISRCAISVQLTEAQIPAHGGSGSVAVTAARDCTWSATSEAQWLTIRSTSSGQGDGVVEFSAAMNPDPAVRRGAIVLNTQRAEVTQAAGSCQITLGESSVNVGQSGGGGTIPVQASSAMCSWTASADEDWVALRPTSGTGNGQVTFEVASTTGPPRTATITIGGQKFSVTQAEGCSYAISPVSQAATPAGGSGTIAIATAQGCPWVAASNVDWISLGQSSGRGPGSVPITIAPSSGPSRTGTAIVAGQTYTVVQSQGCSYAVQPMSHSVGAGGGSVTLSVQAGGGCSWSATSDASWITLTGARSGVGNGTVPLSIAATTGPTRSGAVTIAGQRVTVTQSAGCTFTISPENASLPSAGGTGRINVSGGSGCAWTASSSASWLTITSGASGSGNGEVEYSAAATSGPGRTGTMTVAGRTFTLTQGAGCAFTLSSTSTTIDDGGGTGSFNVQGAAGCGWTAESTVPWITLTPPTSGTGDGQVRFSVAANPGPPRSGAITAGGQTFTVQQGNGCSYSLSASSHNAPASGGSGSVNVAAGNGCTWTATSNASWLSVTSGASGNGNGTVGFTAAGNSGAARSGTLTIGGQQFTVSQATGCSYAIAPTSQTVPAAGATVAVALTTPGSCAWTVTSQAAWLVLQSDASGTGNHAVKVVAQPNTGSQRTGTVDIAGQVLTVTQESGCTYAVAPETVPIVAAGGSSRIDVTAAASCGWTASSGTAWIGVTNGASGTGNGAVDIAIAANAGPARNGTVTIAGRTVTVTQESGCVFGLSATVQPMVSAGGNGSVNVTAAGGCAWAATSNVQWITVTGGASGAGDGAVQFSVAANGTGAPRSGTITIAGLTFTVNQD
jgi:hypothetical protein